jgi:hypothetical protein
MYTLTVEGEVKFTAETAQECMDYGNEYYKDGYSVK